MFESIGEAIEFSKNKNDGGIPLFRYEAIEVRGSDPVEYEDVPWVMIINKGDPKSIIERPKREADEKRWPEHWKAFIEGTEAPIGGVPLKEFPMLTPADIATCHRYHIRTVEDLADYPDVQLKNIGSRGTSLKQKAVKFLEYRKGPDIEALNKTINALTKQVNELEKKVGNHTDNVRQRAAGERVSKHIDSSGQQQPRRKGRPPGSKNRRKKIG